MEATSSGTSTPCALWLTSTTCCEGVGQERCEEGGFADTPSRRWDAWSLQAYTIDHLALLASGAKSAQQEPCHPVLTFIL